MSLEAKAGDVKAAASARHRSAVSPPAFFRRIARSGDAAGSVSRLITTGGDDARMRSLPYQAFPTLRLVQR
jgi:hypothetical protein